MATIEGHLDALTEQVANQLSTMNDRITSVEHTINERLNDQHAWLIALTALAGAQLSALVILAMGICRLGR